MSTLAMSMVSEEASFATGSGAFSGLVCGAVFCSGDGAVCGCGAFTCQLPMPLASLTSVSSSPFSWTVCISTRWRNRGSSLTLTWAEPSWPSWSLCAPATAIFSRESPTQGKIDQSTGPLISSCRPDLSYTSLAISSRYLSGSRIWGRSTIAAMPRKTTTNISVAMNLRRRFMRSSELLKGMWAGARDCPVRAYGERFAPAMRLSYLETNSQQDKEGAKRVVLRGWRFAVA